MSSSKRASAARGWSRVLAGVGGIVVAGHVCVWLGIGFVLVGGLVEEERCCEGEVSVGGVEIAFGLLCVLVSRSNSFDELPPYRCSVKTGQASELRDLGVLVGSSFRHYRPRCAAGQRSAVMVMVFRTCCESAVRE